MQGQLKYSLDTPSGPAERVWYSLAKPLLESEGLAPQTSSDTQIQDGAIKKCQLVLL